MFLFFFFSRRRRHTRLTCDWSSDVCSSDLGFATAVHQHHGADRAQRIGARGDPLGAIELVAAEFDDAHAQHASPAVSGNPSITFMFWMACPAAPLTRLSIAAISVSRGRRTCATGATPIATRLRYTTSLSDGSVPRVIATHGSPS